MIDITGQDARPDGGLPEMYEEGMGLNMSDSPLIPGPLAISENSVSQADAPADATSDISGPHDSFAAEDETGAEPGLATSSSSNNAESQAPSAPDSSSIIVQSTSQDSHPTPTPTPNPTPNPTPTPILPSTVIDTSGNASTPATTAAADTTTTPATSPSRTTAQGPTPVPITRAASPVTMPEEGPTPTFAASGPAPVFGFGPSDVDRHAGLSASDEAPEAQHAGVLLSQPCDFASGPLT